MSLSAFSLDRKLNPGDSGSIVYLEQEERGFKTHRPLAMLIGNWETKIRGKVHFYYRAVILNLAFKDFEKSYDEHISELSLFTV